MSVMDFQLRQAALRVFGAELKEPIVFGRGLFNSKREGDTGKKTYLQRQAPKGKERKLWDSTMSGGGETALQ